MYNRSEQRTIKRSNSYPVID